MFELRYYQKYILNIMYNEKFIYFDLPTGIGKSMIIESYINSLPDKIIGVLCTNFIFNNFNEYFENIHQISPNTVTIDILLKYDIVILYDIVINTKTLILLVDYITSNKQVIIINSGVNKVILNNESNLSKYGLKIYEYTVEKMNEINKLYLRNEKIKKLRNKTLPKN